MSKTGDSLIKVLDGFFEKLIEEVTSRIQTGEDAPEEGGQPEIGFLDRLKVFEAGVRWVAVKSKVNLDDVDDEFGKLRRAHSRAGSRGGGAAKASGNGAATD